MFSQATTRDQQDTFEGHPDQTDILEAFFSLRDELRSVVGDVRGVMKENETLKEEVSRLRSAPSPKRSEVDRIKQECADGLARLQELTAATRAGARGPVPTRSEVRESSAGDSGWMRKMMMVMMMAEMV